MESPPPHQTTFPGAPAVPEKSPGEAVEGPTEGPTDKSVMDAKALLAKEEDFLRFHIGSTKDCRDFFDRHAEKFKCATCNTFLKKNGDAKNTYRLKCPECAKTHSLKGMVQTMRQSADNPSVSGPNELVRKKIKRKLPPPCFFLKKKSENLEIIPDSEKMEGEECIDDDTSDSIPQVADPAHADSQARIEDLLAQVETLKRANAKLEREIVEAKSETFKIVCNHRAEIKKLQEELTNVKMQSLLLSKKQESTSNSTPLPPKGKQETPKAIIPLINSQPKATKPTFRDVVKEKLSSVPAEWKTAKGGKRPQAPKKDARPSEGQPKKKLTDEELSRALLGLNPSPPRSITAVYATGIKSQKYSRLKTLLTDQLGVTLRNVLWIDFIGRSVAEFHVFGDYVETFKELLGRVPSVKFIPIDPLSGDLFKNNEAAEQRSARAAEKYAEKLARRLQSARSSEHRRFLQAEMQRATAAKSKSNDGMVVEAPLLPSQ